ncbi:MAG: hypothetical protein A3J83_03295 [Elusimicrobia bacterium RIFOXYA2_FULL_40_6]|nr:MAG: hypothetical protein A3J83_03295 [Elusimicrobia bacterium RIFOXYA2_FULL_40_6]
MKRKIYFLLLSFTLAVVLAVGNVFAVVCPKCGKDNVDTVKFCVSCGEKMETYIFCGNCGEKNISTNKFCAKCGKEIITPKENNDTKDVKKQNETTKPEETKKIKTTSLSVEKSQITKDSNFLLDFGVGYAYFPIEIAGGSFPVGLKTLTIPSLGKVYGGTNYSFSLIQKVDDNTYLYGGGEVLNGSTALSGANTVTGVRYSGDSYTMQMSGDYKITAIPSTLGIVYHKKGAGEWWEFGLGYYNVTEQGSLTANEEYYDPQHKVYSSTYTYSSATTNVNLAGTGFGVQLGLKLDIPISESVSFMLNLGTRFTTEIELTDNRGNWDKISFRGGNIKAGIMFKL